MHFVHSANGQPVRFWAVNGHRARMEASRVAADGAAIGQVRREPRAPAWACSTKTGSESDSVKRAIAIVEEMKAEGIYSHLSVYFRSGSHRGRPSVVERL